jgi:outer membrane lipoprotein-sorting protein
MLYKIFVSLVVLLTLSFNSFAADKAEEILEKSIKASGGAEKFENLKSWTITADMNVPAQNMDIKVNFWLKKPDKMRVLTEIPSMNLKVEAGTDGKSYWGTQPGSTTRTVVPEMAQAQVKSQLESMKMMFESSNMNFKDKENTFVFKGLEDIDEKKCNVIEVTDKEKSKSDVYFDAITNLMYCSKAEIMNGTEKMTVEMKIKEYQRVDGLTIPKRIEIFQNNQVQSKISFNSVKFNEDIKDSDFEVK